MADTVGIVRRSGARSAINLWVIIGVSQLIYLALLTLLVVLMLSIVLNFLGDLVSYAGLASGAGDSTNSDGTANLQFIPDATDKECQDLYDTLKTKGLSMEMFNAAAAKFNLSPALLAAQAQQESAFNRLAHNPSGAAGLMQIIYDPPDGGPTTWNELYNAKDGHPNDPYNAGGNLYYGAKYMRKMKNMFGTDELALAAYNAGPGTVEKYGNKVPPFQETQNYVAVILGNSQKYANCLGRDSSGGGSGGGPAIAGNFAYFDKARQLGVFNNRLASQLKQNTNEDCYRNTNKFFLYLNAPNEAERQRILETSSGPRSSFAFTSYQGYTSIDYDRNTATRDEQFAQTKTALGRGDYVQWHIRGENSGQHWITILAVDDQQNVTYYDPADGQVHPATPYHAPSRIGGEFFDRTAVDATNGNLWGASYRRR